MTGPRETFIDPQAAPVVRDCIIWQWRSGETMRRAEEIRKREEGRSVRQQEVTT